MRRGLSDGEKKLAKRLQRLAEDELGHRPKLSTCQKLVINAIDKGTLRGPTLEARAAELFVGFETDLAQSGLSSSHAPAEGAKEKVRG